MARTPRRTIKKKAVDYKGGRCESCGYDRCLAALTFHHRRSATKEFGISDTLHVVPWESLRRELNKCSLLCSNCHIELHDEERGINVEDPSRPIFAPSVGHSPG